MFDNNIENIERILDVVKKHYPNKFDKEYQYYRMANLHNKNSKDLIRQLVRWFDVEENEALLIYKEAVNE